MTSANVIEYTIFDKEGKEVGRHRQNVLCARCNDGLEAHTPAEDFTIQPWGYDEEEELWENEPTNLKKWLEKNRAEITFKKFSEGDSITLKKGRGNSTILEVRKGKWFPEYLVKLENGEEITINQNEIIP